MVCADLLWVEMAWNLSWQISPPLAFALVLFTYGAKVVWAKISGPLGSFLCKILGYLRLLSPGNYPDDNIPDSKVAWNILGGFPPSRENLQQKALDLTGKCNFKITHLRNCDCETHLSWKSLIMLKYGHSPVLMQLQNHVTVALGWGLWGVALLFRQAGETCESSQEIQEIWMRKTKQVRVLVTTFGSFKRTASYRKCRNYSRGR